MAEEDTDGLTYELRRRVEASRREHLQSGAVRLDLSSIEEAEPVGIAPAAFGRKENP